MAGDSVKYEYQALEDMARELMNGYALMEDTQRFIRQISGQMRDGAFLGLAGDMLATLLADQFARSVHNLGQKYKEMAQDVQAAGDLMQQADQQAAKGFN